MTQGMLIVSTENLTCILRLGLYAMLPKAGRLCLEPTLPLLVDPLSQEEKPPNVRGEYVNHVWPLEASFILPSISDSLDHEADSGV